MYTLIETPLFTADASTIWREDERGEFCAWLAQKPLAGDVIPGAGGCRKVRWSRSGMDKQGGVRVIYAKAVRGNIPAHLRKAIQEEIENDHDQQAQA